MTDAIIIKSGEEEKEKEEVFVKIGVNEGGSVCLSRIKCQRVTRCSVHQPRLPFSSSKDFYNSNVVITAALCNVFTSAEKKPKQKPPVLWVYF